MLPDVPDARRTVRPEQESHHLRHEIGIRLAPAYILAASGTGIETLAVGASPDLAPCRLLKLPATGAFLLKILTACTAIKTARGNQLFV